MCRSIFQGLRFRCVVWATLYALTSAGFAVAADRALIVGIGKFAESSMNLQGIDLDVRLMQEVADRLGFKQIDTLRDSEATLDGFTRKFEELIEGTGSDDRIMIYFSSHGTRVPDDDGDETDNQDEVLVMHDTRIRDSGLETFLRDDEFSALLRRLPSRDVLVFIDACNSGTVYKAIRLGEVRLGEREAHTKFIDYPGMPTSHGYQAESVAVDKNVGVAPRPVNFAFLAAAADDELAIATPSGSVFTLGVNAVINEAARTRQPLTLRTLKDKVAAYIEDKLSPGRVHHPQLGGNPDLLDKPLRPTLPNQGGRIWQDLETLAGTGMPFTVKASQQTFRVDDEVVFTIDIPHAGFLNVVNVGPDDQATVLFPNKYYRDNHVSAGTLTLPTDQMPFYFPAMEPTGRTLTVVFLTEKKVNMYEDAVEGRDKTGELTASLASLSAKATRNVGVASRQDPSYAAGKVIFEVVAE